MAGFEPSFSRRQFLTNALVAGAVTRFAPAAFADSPHKWLDRVPEWMKMADVPGCSVALIRDASVVHVQGFGLQVMGTDERVDERTVFEAASLTKPVFAYLAMKLVESGRLDLDAPLAPMFDEPITDKNLDRLAQITARHVLSHSSGLPNWRPRGKALRVQFDPGTRFQYSGEGFVLLQRVVERITGEPLDVYAQHQLFDPIEMESASLVWRDDYATRLAGGHDPSRTIHGARVKRTRPNAAASLVCTPGDYAKFVCALLAPPAEDVFHLNARSIDAMFTPQINVADGVDWGLGWGLQTNADGPSFWHWGNQNEVYHNFVIANRETRSGVVVFTNGRNGMQVYTPTIRAAMGAESPALDWINR